MSTHSGFREQLLFTYKGGKVKRFHTTDTLAAQTVGEHSHGVAMLCYLLTDGKPSVELLMSALTHDLAEHLIGDIASPVKRSNPVLYSVIHKAEEDAFERVHLNIVPRLKAEEHRILKLADYMDGMMFCVREAQFGSQKIWEVYDNFRSYVVALDPNFGLEQILLAIIDQLWEEEQ